MPLNRSQAPTSLPPGHLGDEVLYERHSSAVIHSFGLVFLTIIEQPLIFTFAGLVAYGASPVKDSGLARGIMGGAAASGVVCAVIQIFILRAMFALEHVKPVNMKVPRPAARDANERETTRNNFGLGKLQEANQDRAGEDVSVSTLNGLQSPGFVVSLAMYLLWLGGSYSRALLSAVVISAILESKFQLGFPDARIIEAAAVAALPLLFDTAYYLSRDARKSKDIIQLGSEWPVTAGTKADTWATQSIVIGTSLRLIRRVIHSADRRTKYSYKTSIVAISFSLALAFGGFGMLTLITFAKMLGRRGIDVPFRAFIAGGVVFGIGPLVSIVSLSALKLRLECVKTGSPWSGASWP